ncbi:hypothetical protein MPER_08470 [Moniliophthora perniciosa FA553]|nr:hypothetical protein MPER_08470 [Moniliophthora perniciosa FA553]
MTFPEIFSAITSSVGSVKRLLIAPRSNPLPVISVSVPVSLPSSLTHIEFGDSYPSILTSIASSSTLERLTFPISHGAEELQATAINEFLESSVSVKNGCLKNCKLVLKPGGNNGDAQTMLIDSLSKILHFHKFKGWTLEADCEAFVHVRIDTIPNVTTVVLQNFKNTEDWALGSLDRILSGLSLFPDLRDVEVPISRSGERDPEMLQRSGWDKVDGTVLEGSEAHYAARIVVRKIRSSLYRCYEKGLLKMRVIYRPRIWFDDWLSLATLQ